ncbi:MAG: PQQ-binding-like beta-propeller repeat protein, partial [Candidatus Hydrogenedentota bacterium]
SPVIVGNKVFLVSNDAELSKLFGISLDRDSGKVLWQKQLAEAHGPIPRNTLAACSPVADAERVYFTFGSGPVFALDHDGNEVWSRNIKDLGRIGLQFGYASSPTLYKGNLYYPILTGQWRSEIPLREYHDGDSFLLALDAKTGDIVFHHHRDSDAIGESYDSYTTVVPYEVGEEPVIVVQGGDYTTGHDIATGEERWRFADNPRKRSNWRLIPSPIVIGDLIFNAQPRGSLAYAFNPGVKAQKDIETAAWVYNSRTTDVPTPVFYDGKLYVLNGVQKTLACFDPKSGEELWVGDLPDNKRFWSSPVAADGKIYMVDEDGGVVVVSIGEKFEILSRGAFGGRGSKASPAISDGKLFIRTSEKLYCIGS